ncbi:MULTISPECIES: hypothetical protein [unclassified Nocardioides]|uniref:hypothetical protein n=1 Tax=unclassified Nocardioides TaxID=2615069 RepID=UPI0006F213A2|nr:MULTISPECIES: hypothetical protein [unclassified Nocardioides]KRA38854.1 hypothetical protein ASD81_09760 [Nocardioides sp. Root614]KRA92814.1 hypothetical protein ASD84_10025 [Nocardioides sp. Root682]
MNLPLIRKVALGVLLLDVLVIGAAAVQVDDVSSTTSAPLAGVPVPLVHGAPTAVPVDASAVEVFPAVPGTPLPAAVPIGDGGVSAGTDKPSSDGRGPTPPPEGPETPGEEGVPGGRGIPPCPVKLDDDPQSGGLQSLVPFAPAFGPFSAEAFALASAYQPELQLLGPILAQYPGIEPAVAPIIDPLVTSLGTLLTRGLDVIAPLYGPYRTQFLEAETKLAAALAPYSQALAHNELGGCIVELQSALLAASKRGAPSVSSPTGLDLSALDLSALGGSR